MNKFSRWFKTFFPTHRVYRQQADEIIKEVDRLKTLTLNGDREWFIRECRKHRDEVCNGDAN